jgi:hypothetical protein
MNLATGVKLQNTPGFVSYFIPFFVTFLSTHLKGAGGKKISHMKAVSQVNKFKF